MAVRVALADSYDDVELLAYVERTASIILYALNCMLYALNCMPTFTEVFPVCVLEQAPVAVRAIAAASSLPLTA